MKDGSSAFIGVAFLAWVIVSSFIDGSKRRKQQILSEMSDSYSKEEALELMYGAVREARIMYLAYGGVIGASFLAAMK